MTTMESVRKEWKNVIFNLVVIILTMVSVVYLNNNELLTTYITGAIAIIGLIKWRSKITLILFIAGGIIFGLAEPIIVNYQVWAFSSQGISNIPLWLFVIWGTTCAFIYQTSVEIKKLGVEEWQA